MGARETLRIGIAGRAALGPEPELPFPLEDVIYRAVSAALAQSAMSIGEVDGVCMAASDLNDGRAISTMTLTGSTGSLGRNELRVCNDGLAAAWVGAAEVASGAADVLVICAWSKLSDAKPSAIAPLALEPAFHRALAVHPDAFLAMRASAERSAITVLSHRERVPVDAAVAVVITRTGHAKAGPISLTGFGSCTGPYLRPGVQVLGPTLEAGRRACAGAGVTIAELASVVVGSLDPVDDDELAEGFGIPVTRINRAGQRGLDLGYASGLMALDSVVAAAAPGRHLVVSAGGVGLDNAHAVVVEVP
jgi:hypothetical protein